MRAKDYLLVCAAGLVGACGGSKNPPVTADTPASVAPPPAAVATAEAKPESTAVPPFANPAKDAPARSTGSKKVYEDLHETEHGATITMTPLLQKGTKSAFPTKTVGDRECWQGTMLAGDAKKDFDDLVKKCGSPTGLVEYTKPVLGKLHHEHDKRDTYKLKLLGGMCYRYFAVADAGIKDIDILITKPNGAIVADDRTTQPVAIIEFDKSWCMDSDAEYDFHIEVDGVGTGHYMFGVWVKPKG